MSLPFLSESPTSVELALWCCAVFGTLFFFARLVLTFVTGIGSDVDSSAFDAVHHGASHIDYTEAAFKLISLNTVASFLMMFGWSGLCAHSQFELGEGLSVVIAFGVGFFAMFVTAGIYRFALQLASAGADFRSAAAIGSAASVYQRIPAGGTGKIQVTVNDQLYELDARSSESEEIPSFEFVRVIEAVDHNTVVVSRISKPTGDIHE